MAQTLTQRMMELGVPFVMANELVKQMNAGVYNVTRLINAGWVEDLARYLAVSLPAGTFKATKAVEYSMIPAISTLVAGGGGVPVLLRSARIVAVGDSNTQYGAVSAAGLGHQNLSDIPVLASLTGDYNVDIFDALWSITPGWQGANYGVAGETASSIIPRMRDAMKYQPGVPLYLAGGTNDGADNGTAGVNVANIYIAAAQEARDVYGAPWVIIRAIPPLSGAQHSTSRAQGRAAFASTVAAFAAANPSWCKFVDIYTPNIQASGEAVAGYLLADGLHFAEFGISLNMAIVKPIFDSIFAAGPSNLVANFSANNQLANGLLTGNAGAKTGVTGDIATGWTASFTGAPTVAASVAANPDTGGQYQQFDITPASGSGTDVLTLTPTPNSALVSGDWYEAWMEVEVTGGRTVVSHPGVGFKTQTQFNSQAGIALYPKQFLRTPPFKATGASKPTITVDIPRSAAAFSVKIRRAFVVPIADPYITWNTGLPPVNTAAPAISGTPGVGNILTVSPGTWLGVLVGSQQQNRYRYRLYRDGVLVSTTDASGNLAYTQVAADAGSVLSFTVDAANQASARSAAVAVSNTVAIPDIAWKSQYDYVANTGNTNGVADANSLSALTCARSTVGYDYLFTTQFAANVPRRTNRGLLVEPAISYFNFPTLPDNAGNWVYSNAVCTPNGGAAGPEGTLSSLIVMSAPAGYAQRVITGSGGYRSAKAIVKGTAGQQVLLSYTPGSANPTSILHTLTGGWDIIDLPNIFAGNSNMTVRLANVAGQASLTLDVAYVGVSISGAGSATALLHSPLPLTTAAGASVAEGLSLTAPSGSATGVFTFDDNSKQTVAVAAGTYNIPTNLTRRQIKSFKIT